MTTPSPIPEGWMLVPKAWQPIMDEIERRADKMSGDSRFTVEIDADDIESINATPSPISDQAGAAIGEPNYPGTYADIIEKALYCNLHGDTESVENWLIHLREKLSTNQLMPKAAMELIVAELTEARKRESTAPTTASSDQAAGEREAKRDGLAAIIRHHTGATAIDGYAAAQAVIDAMNDAPTIALTTSEELKERVCDAIAQALGDAYDCDRVWSAWSVGTMRQDDFYPVADSSERVAEIADAAINALSTAPTTGSAPDENVWRQMLQENFERQEAGFERCYEALGITDDRERSWSTLVIALKDAAPASPAASVLTDSLVADLRSYARIMRAKEDNQHCVDRDCAEAAEQMEWAALRIEGLENQLALKDHPL